VNNLNDNDRLFTILTRDAGRITAMAKGVRSIRHKDFAGLQLFCYSSLVLDNKTGLHYISSAEPIETFYPLRESVEKMSLAVYLMDVVNAVSRDFLDADGYFSFILNTLFLLGNAEQRLAEQEDGDLLTELRRLKMVFELKTCVEAGYAPETECCVLCGTPGLHTHFDCVSGGVVCASCGGERENLIPVTPGEVKAITYLAQADLKQVFRFTLKDEVLDTLSAISEQFLAVQFETFFPSLDYLKSIWFQ